MFMSAPPRVGYDPLLLHIRRLLPGIKNHTTAPRNGKCGSSTSHPSNIAANGWSLSLRGGAAIRSAKATLSSPRAFVSASPDATYAGASGDVYFNCDRRHS